MKVIKLHAVVPQCSICKKALKDGEPYYLCLHHFVNICVRCAPFDDETAAEGYVVDLDHIDSWIHLLEK